MNLAGGLAVGVFLTIYLDFLLQIFWYQQLAMFGWFLVLIGILPLVLVAGLLEGRLTTPRPPDQDDPPSPRGLSTPSPRDTMKP